MRTEFSLALARLAVLEAVGHKLEFMNGTRSPGPKPDGTVDVYSALQVLMKCAKLIGT